MQIRILVHAPASNESEGKAQIFSFPPVRRRRPWAGLCLSIGLHVAGIASLLVGGSTVTKPAISEDGQPLRIKIGNKIYLVTRLPLKMPAAAQGPGSGAGRAGKAIPQMAGSVAQAAVKNAVFKSFTPPAGTHPTAPEIVYLPELSTEIVAANRVPNVVVWTPVIPKLPPRRMILPGVRHSPVAEIELPPVPDVPVSAETARMNPKLPLPQISQAPPVEYVGAPPVTETDMGITGMDPIRILAMSTRPAPPAETVTLPRGNLSPTAALGPSTNAGPPGRHLISGSPSLHAEEAQAAGQATGAGNGSNGYGVGDTGATGAGARQSGANHNATGNGSGHGSSAGSVSGSDSSNGIGSGPRAAMTAGPGGGFRDDRSVNGTGPGGSRSNVLNGALTARSGIGSDPLLDPRLTRIVQPHDGRYDAIVVQSGPPEALEESRKLLTGSPVYTVYLSLGTRKDWILQYCLPRDRVATVSGSGYIIQINNSTPVAAPWPTLMMRAPIGVRAGQLYVIVHGFVSDSGKMERLNIVRFGSDETNQLLMTALAAWQFRPAMQDGRPITVEFLLAIPPDQL